MINKKVITSVLLTVTMTFHAYASLPILEVSYFESTDKTQPQEEIFMLQKVLNDLGYVIEEDKDGNPAEPNGIFGPKTVAALKEFQKENGLKVTGDVNTETIDTLNNLSEFVNKNDSANPTEEAQIEDGMQGEPLRPSFFGWLRDWFMNLWK